MARAAGSGVKLLAEREEIVRAAQRAAARQSTNAFAVEAVERRTERIGHGALPRAPCDVRAGSNQVRLLASVGTGTAAGEGNHVIGAVGAQIAHATAIVAADGFATVSDGVRMDVFGGADANDVLGRAWRASRPTSGAGIAGGEHDHHFLVARGGHNRAVRLRVADQRVVLLAVGVVITFAIGTPTIGADSGTIAVSERLQVRVVGRGKGAGVKDHRGTDAHKRRNTQAVAEPGGVGEREAGEVVVAGDDVGVERAVAVAALKCAAAVRRAHKPVVGYAARQAGVAQRIKPEVPRHGGRVVQTAVRHIHRKSRRFKLRLRETFARQPREVTGSARKSAAQIARDDLPLPLVPLLGQHVGPDGHHLRLRRQRGQRVGRQAHNDVEVVQNFLLFHNWRQLAGVNDRQRGRVRRGISHHLNGEQIPRQRARLVLLVHQANLRVKLVFIPISAFPLHRAGGGGQRLHPAQRGGVAINEVGVVRHVGHDLRPAGDQIGVPLRLHRPGKLHEMQPLTFEGGQRLPQRLHLGSRGAQRTGVQLDDIQVVRRNHRAGGGH